MTELRHVMGLLTMADEGGVTGVDGPAAVPARNPAWTNWKRWSGGSGTPGCWSN